MGVSVVNDTGEHDYYVGFSNVVNTDVSTALGYFKALTSDANGVFNKLPTDDTPYSSGSFAYVTIVHKAPTGGAIVMKVDDLVGAYGDGVSLRLTNSITSAGVYSNYANGGTNYPDGIIPLGTKQSEPRLYVQLPSYTITSNVLGSSDPSNYAVGDMISKPLFAFTSSTFGLALVDTPFIRKSKPGGWPIWIWSLIVILFIVLVVVIIAGAMMGYKKYKNR